MGITNGGLITSSSKVAQQDTLALSDGLACFTGSFSGVTSTSISHGLNSSDLIVEFKDSAGNLLIPDTWSITNLNVIEVEFTPAATGDVTIVACIESGLAPITGGVTLLEGLSGIIDLDCPNGSVDITTSGQVINICAIFTPESGALLQQKCEDINILSGLIGGGSGTTVNGISGTVLIESVNDAIAVITSGNTILLSGLFTAESGSIVDQKCADILILSGLIATASAGGHVDQRSVSGSIVPDTSGIYALGATDLTFSHVFATSGIFKDRIHLDPRDSDPLLIEEGDIWLRNNNDQFERLAYQATSGIREVRDTFGYADYHRTSAQSSFTDGDAPLAIILDNTTVVDSLAFSQNAAADTIFVWIDGLYKISYGINLTKTDRGDESTIAITVEQNGTELANASTLVWLEEENIGNGGAKTFLAELNAGDELQVLGQFIEGRGDVVFDQSSNVTLEFIRGL